MHDLPTTALLGVRPSLSVLADCALAKPRSAARSLLFITSLMHATLMSKVKVGKPCNKRGLQKLDMPDRHF